MRRLRAPSFGPGLTIIFALLAAIGLVCANGFQRDEALETARANGCDEPMLTGTDRWLIAIRGCPGKNAIIYEYACDDGPSVDVCCTSTRTWTKGCDPL